jgi:hypothetical protein
VIRLRRTRSECEKNIVSAKVNLISSACLPYRLRVIRLRSLKESHQALAFIEKFDGRKNSLWSLAVSLWLDYRNENEYHTKD